MFRTRYLLIPILFFAAQAKGQPAISLANTIGKTFVSNTLEYLQFINDSTLCSSINKYTDTASFMVRSDTLFTRQQYRYLQQNGFGNTSEYNGYKIIHLTADTIYIENNRRANDTTNRRETIVFINIEKLQEPVTVFKSLTLQVAGWSGSKRIIIDNTGKVLITTNLPTRQGDTTAVHKKITSKKITGQLTEIEFTHFKALLSRSLLSRLPIKTSCPPDAAVIDLEVVTGSKKYSSSGCHLSWVHQLLFDYVYDIDKNKSFVKN